MAVKLSEFLKGREQKRGVSPSLEGDPERKETDSKCN
jgi:hypothetical protein